MKEIKIAIACHKESVLPKNSLYIPVQVGSALSSKQLKMQRDDTGENISKKNPMYCELTAQYWAWKNWEADYYGLCHYRRYLYFGNKKYSVDLRKQIIVDALNEYTCDKYGLNNEAEMRKIIEANDCVVGTLEDVRVLPTPYGYKKTVYEHWIAHDRALIMKQDLDMMLNIMKRKYPSIAKDAAEYLAGHYFLGYNCFVMKKELFFKLCEFEFDILKELEQKVDLNNYNQQIKRIYGFMGEILYSVFIYHLEKSKQYKIAHIPVMYFNYTESVPKFDDKKDTDTIVLVQKNTPHFMLAPAIESFLENCNLKQKYEIIIMHDNMELYFINKYKAMAQNYENVNLIFFNLLNVYWIESEGVAKDEAKIPWQLFLPWILATHKKILLVDWNHIFLKDVDELFTLPLEGACIAAPLDVYEIGCANGIYSDVYYYRKEKVGLRNVYKYINTSLMVIDLKMIRNKYKPEILYDSFIKMREKSNYKDVINKIYEGDFYILNTCWSVQTFSNTETKHHIPYSPNNMFNDFKKAEKDPYIIEYFPDDPWYPIGNQFDIEFWKYARCTPFYETFFAHMVARRTDSVSRSNLIDKFFPKNTKRRMVLMKIAPKMSKRYKILKRFYDMLRG